MPATATAKRRYYYKNRKYWRRRRKANFFKIASKYVYAKIDSELFMKPFITGQNLDKLSAYAFGFTGNASTAQQYTIINFKQILPQLNEWLNYAHHFQCFRIRALRLDINKYYDPVAHSNATANKCDLQNGIKILCNMNNDISSDEGGWNLTNMFYSHQQHYKVFRFNRNKTWNNCNSVAADMNNTIQIGYVGVDNQDPENKEITQLQYYPWYKCKFTFYILFKNNVLN